jgi:hypothetical protein
MKNRIFLLLQMAILIGIAFYSCQKDECEDPVITAYSQVEGGDLIAGDTVVVVPGESVLLSPGPDEGTWSWTGPNGFTASTREITIDNVQVDAEYVVTNTVDGGCNASLTFYIIACAPNTLDYAWTTDGWTSVDVKTLTPAVTVGTTLTLGPGPNKGTWSWTGPNGFTATTREITFESITLEDAGTYVAVNTSSCGSTASLTYVITVTTECLPTPLNYAWTTDGWSSVDVKTLTPAVTAGSTLTLGPGPNTGTWSWTGPNGFTADTREVTFENITLAEAGTYVAVNTNDCGASASLTFVITVSSDCLPTPLNWAWTTDGWSSVTNNLVPIITLGTGVEFGPGPNTGTWAWTGPNGFTGTARDFVLSDNVTENMAGDYVAVNTNDCGADATIIYTLYVNPVGCTPNPHMDANWTTDGWSTVHSDQNPAVTAGATLIIGPGPNPTTYPGTWVWKGPNGFTADTREISFPTGITTDQAGQYSVVYKETATGCYTSLDFNVQVSPVK